MLGLDFLLLFDLQRVANNWAVNLFKFPYVVTLSATALWNGIMVNVVFQCRTTITEGYVELELLPIHGDGK